MAATALAATAASPDCGSESEGCLRAGFLDQELCPLPSDDSNEIEDAHIACLCAQTDMEYWEAIAMCLCTSTAQEIRSYYCDGDNINSDSASPSDSAESELSSVEAGSSVTDAPSGSVTPVAIASPSDESVLDVSTVSSNLETTSSLESEASSSAASLALNSFRSSSSSMSASLAPNSSRSSSSSNGSSSSSSDNLGTKNSSSFLLVALLAMLT